MRAGTTATLTITMVLTAAFAAAQTCELVNPCGDVNDSGSVTAGDALTVLQTAVGQDVETICEVAATGLSAPPLKTAQTLCHTEAGAMIACAGTGHDGETQAGAARAYAENEDGTITDLSTGLTWEILDYSNQAFYAGIHSLERSYNWNAALARIEELNSNSFAGHSDWRLPNILELGTLFDYSRSEPAIESEFEVGCAPSCEFPSCSCTGNFDYWTSTSFAHFPAKAWVIDFSGNGTRADEKKHLQAKVRAVRGGL